MESMEDTTKCVLCNKGETSRTPGSASCGVCALGEYGGVTSNTTKTSYGGTFIGYGTYHELARVALVESKSDNQTVRERQGFCFDCPAGFYNDAKSSLECRRCPADTFGIKTRATAKGDCTPCIDEHALATTTSGRTGVWNPTTGCLCMGARPASADPQEHAGYYTTTDLVGELSKNAIVDRHLCLQCPSGADCEFDGMQLSEISAQNGFWRPHNMSTSFTDCQQAFPGLLAEKMAKEVCCYNHNKTKTNVSSSRSFNSMELHLISSCKHIPSYKNVTMKMFHCKDDKFDSLLCKKYTVGDPQQTQISFFSNVTFDSTDQQCLPGYTGTLCGECAENYVRVDNIECSYCKGGPSLLLSFGVMGGASGVFSIILAIMLRFCIKTTRSLDEAKEKTSGLIGQAKILLTFFQLLAACPGVMSTVPWPKLFIEMTSPLKMFNLNILNLFAGFPAFDGCGMSLPYLNQFIIDMSFPGMIALAIMMAYLLGKKDDEKQERRKATLYKIVIMLTLFLFPGISTSIFTMFRCVSVKGIEGTRLAAQLSVVCHEGQHATMTIVALVFTVIYVVGTPLAIFVALWRNRAALHDENHPRHESVEFQLGSLYSSYEPKFWYFELIILVHKLFMTGVLVIVGDGTPAQPLAACVFQLFILLLTLKLAPYSADTDDFSSLISSMSLMLTMMCAFSLASSNELLLTTFYCLIVVNFVTFAIEIGIMVSVWWQERKENIALRKAEEEEDKKDPERKIIREKRAKEIKLREKETKARKKQEKQDRKMKKKKIKKKKMSQVRVTVVMPVIDDEVGDVGDVGGEPVPVSIPIPPLTPPPIPTP